MPRRRTKPQPHREFFRPVGLDETVATPCTCARGADHWYAEPIAESGPGGDGLEALEAADAEISRSPRRSPGRAERAS